MATRRHRLRCICTSVAPGLFGQVRARTITPTTAIKRSKPVVVEDPRSRDGSNDQKTRVISSISSTRRSVQIRVTHLENSTSIQVISRRIPRDHANSDCGVKISKPRFNLYPITNEVKFSIDTSPPGRVQTAPPTGKQGEEGFQDTKAECPLR